MKKEKGFKKWPSNLLAAFLLPQAWKDRAPGEKAGRPSLSGEGDLTKVELEVRDVCFGALHFGDLLKSMQALLPPHSTPCSGHLLKFLKLLNIFNLMPQNQFL